MKGRKTIQGHLEWWKNKNEWRKIENKLTYWMTNEEKWKKIFF